MSCADGDYQDCDCQCHEDYQPRNFYREVNEIACAILGHKVKVHRGGPTEAQKRRLAQEAELDKERRWAPSFSHVGYSVPIPLEDYEWRECMRCFTDLGGTRPRYRNAFRDLIDEGTVRTYGVFRS